MFKYRSSQSFDFVSSSLSSFLVLLSSGVLLGLEFLSVDLFGFLLEDCFDQDGFVLKLVTFGCKIESVIKSSVDLF